MYIILSGYPPFHASNHQDLFELIKRGMYKFHDDQWGKISEEAKDQVANLLKVNPRKRSTATVALYSTWMKKDAEILKGQDLSDNLNRFRRFNAKRKVKQAVLAVSLILFLLSLLKVQATHFLKCFQHIAMKKMTHFIGLGKDQTFGFNHAANPVRGIEAHSTQAQRNAPSKSTSCCF